MPVISGKAYWPKLHTPMGTQLNPDDKRYSLDVGNLDKTNKKIADDLGMNVKFDDPDSGKANAGLKGNFVTLKKYGYDYNGELNAKPSLVDSQNNSLEDVYYKTLGNGSGVNVKFTSKTTKSGYQQFHLDAVQVISLVEYHAPDTEEQDESSFNVIKDGFTQEEIPDLT